MLAVFGLDEEKAFIAVSLRIKLFNPSSVKRLYEELLLFGNNMVTISENKCTVGGAGDVVAVTPIFKSSRGPLGMN